MISAHWILSSNTWFQLAPSRMVSMLVARLSQGCPRQGLGSTCCSCCVCRQPLLLPPRRHGHPRQAAPLRNAPGKPQARLLHPSPPALRSPELSAHVQPPLRTPRGVLLAPTGLGLLPRRAAPHPARLRGSPGLLRHPAPTTGTCFARLYIRYQGLNCSRKQTEGLQCIL